MSGSLMCEGKVRSGDRQGAFLYNLLVACFVGFWTSSGEGREDDPILPCSVCSDSLATACYECATPHF